VCVGVCVCVCVFKVDTSADAVELEQAVAAGDGAGVFARVCPCAVSMCVYFVARLCVHTCSMYLCVLFCTYGS
jgi:hypothetical protein